MARCLQSCALQIWIIHNEALLNLILSFLSFAVTSVLTMVIIRQTSKLAKKQSEQERLIHKQQEELQKRQIKIDLFEYKNNIYHALIKVFQMTGEIDSLLSRVNLQEKTMEQLYEFFNVIQEQLSINASEFLWLFRQAEYILPSNIYDSVYSIACDFDELGGSISKFNLYSKGLTPDEIVVQKKILLDDILSRAKQINRHVSFINSVMPQELNISSLEK